MNWIKDWTHEWMNPCMNWKMLNKSWRAGELTRAVWTNSIHLNHQIMQIKKFNIFLKRRNRWNQDISPKILISYLLKYIYVILFKILSLNIWEVCTTSCLRSVLPQPTSMRVCFPTSATNMVTLSGMHNSMLAHAARGTE